MPAEKSTFSWYSPVGNFLRVYAPTVFDNHVSSIQVNGNIVELTSWDTRGEKEYDYLQPSQYPETDVILCFFSIDRPNSWRTFAKRWVNC